jgi:Zn-dependent protease with chaperone function
MLSCPRCGSKTQDSLLYCLNCRSRLVSSSKYDLNPNDFAYKPDLDAIETIKVTGFLPFLLKRLALADFERNLLTQLSEKATRILYPSDFDEIMRHCAGVLSLDALPEIFVSDGYQLNAFTFGTEGHACVVLTSALLRIVSRQELEAVLSHEFAHVKSGHMLYHTLAEVLASGIGTSASLLGLDLISIPIRLALLSWHRESEVTADRGSLLVVNDIHVLRTLLSKLASAVDPASSGRTNIDTQKPGALDSLGELFRTHPLDSNRFRLANEFWESQEFKRGRRKIELRQRVLKALTPVCRFCGHSKSVEALFCPNCGRSQS